MHIHDITIMTDPSRTERVKELLADQSESCLLLDIERLVGLHLAGFESSLREFRKSASFADDHYGADRVEVDA